MDFTLKDVVRLFGGSVLAIGQLAFFALFFLPTGLTNFYKASIANAIWTVIAVALPFLLIVFYKWSKQGYKDELSIIVLTELSVLGYLQLVEGSFATTMSSFISTMFDAMNVFGYVVIGFIFIVLVVMNFVVVAYWTKRYDEGFGGLGFRY